MRTTRTLIALTTILLAADTHAQATLSASNPADGATVVAPAQVWLIYSNPVMLASVKLETAAGNEIAIGAVPDGFRETFVIAVGQSLNPGNYVVTWRAIDGKSRFSDGQFQFGVNGTPK